MSDVSLTLQTIIAIMASLSGLGFLFHLLLNPVKKDIKRIEVEIKDIKALLLNLKHN